MINNQKTDILDVRAIHQRRVSRPLYGKYYSLDFPLPISSNYDKDQAYILLSHNFTYYFLIHDPYFFGFYNPSYPMVRKAAINPNLTLNYYHFLIVTNVEELDLPGDPCQPGPDYIYQTCFKQSLSR